MMRVTHWRGRGRRQRWRPTAGVKGGHDCVRDVSNLTSRVPGLPPLPGVVDDLEKLAPDDSQLLFVVGRSRICDLKCQIHQKSVVMDAITKSSSFFRLLFSCIMVVMLFWMISDPLSTSLHFLVLRLINWCHKLIYPNLQDRGLIYGEPINFITSGPFK